MSKTKYQKNNLHRILMKAAHARRIANEKGI